MTETAVTPLDQARFTEAMDELFKPLGGTVGVMVRMLGDDDRSLTYNHTDVYPTASTLKTPLLYELYRQADAGKVDLTERVTLWHKDRTPGSGILQDLDEGLQPTIRDLAELMIIVSDNWATDMVYERIGKDNIAQMLRELGLNQTHIPLNIRELFCALADVDPTDPKVDYQFLKDYLSDYRPAADNIGYACDERNDTSSPADMIRLMVLIDQGHGLTDESREGVLKILKDQNFSTIIPARLPSDEGIETAHKTGSLRGIKNDVGLVYSPKVNYAVAFMSKDQEDVPEAVDRMARASRWIWDYLSGLEAQD
ncbi:MAG TPA: serine hydrolase [Thermomicrobiales bacterium]|nr:serine hydrolase [Thermomicrobiales bacterium]